MTTVRIDDDSLRDENRRATIESLRSCERCMFWGCNFTAENLAPVVEALMESDGVVEIGHTMFCRFDDRTTMNLFARVMQKDNLRSLVLRARIHNIIDEALVSLCRNPTAPLRSLEYDPGSVLAYVPEQFREDDRDPTVIDFVLKSHTLESLSLTVYGSLQWDPLIDGLRDSKLKHLKVRLKYPGQQERQHVSFGLLEAMSHNYSLRTVELLYRPGVEGPVPLLEDPNSRRRLEFYLDRNARLANWVVDPSTVPVNLWPHVLSMARRRGQVSLRRAVQATVGVDDFGVSRSRSRKRKRPDYYIPG